jgi:hypothetical protein
MQQGAVMMTNVQELVAERAAALAGRVAHARRTSLDSARQAARGSASSIKSLKHPVRIVARSGVRLTNVSQTLSQSLIELQTEMVTAALTDVALRLERASRASNIGELLRDQIELVPATRARIVDEAQRAARIFRDAGRNARSVATHAYQSIVEPAEAPAATPTAKRRPRKAQRKTRARKAA